MKKIFAKRYSFLCAQFFFLPFFHSRVYFYFPKSTFFSGTLSDPTFKYIHFDSVASSLKYDVIVVILSPF